MLVLKGGKGKKRIILSNCIVVKVEKFISEFTDPMIPKVEYETTITHGDMSSERAEIKVISFERLFKKGQKVDVELR